jgi:hypothetical protein
MKKYLIVVLVLLASQVTRAQGLFSWGLRGGLSSSVLQVSESFDVSGTSVKYTKGDAILGWHAGVFTRFKLSLLYIQPELLISQSGGGINIDSAGTVTQGTLTFNNLDIPVMVGVRFAKILRVNAGPVFSFMLSNKMSDNMSGWDQKYKSGTIGYQAGIGADLSRLLIDLKYQGSLSKLGDSVTIPGTSQSFNTDMKNSQIILSLGIRI